MLPDFPKIKNRLRERIDNELNKASKEDPFLRTLKEVRHFEGDKHSTLTAKKFLEKSKYNKLEVKFNLTKKEVLEKGPSAYIEKIHAVKKQVAKKKSKIVFSTLDKVIKRSGNEIKAEGQEFSFDHFIEMLRKIQIDFDDQGNPHLPSIVVHPSFAEKNKHKWEEWNVNPEYKKKMEELILKKKEEWHARESNRKLVD